MYYVNVCPGHAACTGGPTSLYNLSECCGPESNVITSRQMRAAFAISAYEAENVEGDHKKYPTLQRMSDRNRECDEFEIHSEYNQQHLSSPPYPRKICSSSSQAL